MNPTKNHPNATAAAGTTGAGAVLVWALGLAGVTVPPVAAVTIAGGLTVVFLAVGRRGIKGVARMVWSGSEEETGV